MLLEILVNFLAQPSNVMRHVVELVFRSICPHLTPTAFQQLTEVGTYILNFFTILILKRSLTITNIILVVFP